MMLDKRQLQTNKIFITEKLMEANYKFSAQNQPHLLNIYDLHNLNDNANHLKLHD